ncbi:hypothetical protein C8Q72DRAFT_637097 [Fomitopsis betulina]|nr:hypothetical protein C8Q72DRAFT_637097 [Fomitopsis betulina]
MASVDGQRFDGVLRYHHLALAHLLPGPELLSSLLHVFELPSMSRQTCGVLPSGDPIQCAKIPEPPHLTRSLRRDMGLDKNTFLKCTKFMRDLADQHLDPTKSLHQQLPVALNRVMEEAGKHPVLMHYANIWPLKIYLRDWMVPSRRSRRHNPTNAKSCMKQSKVMLPIQNPQTAQLTHTAQVCLRESQERSVPHPSPPQPGSERHIHGRSATPRARAAPAGKISFRKFLKLCRPNLRPLRREFKRAGVKSPSDFLRMARLGDKYREGLLRGRMYLTELQIAEVKTVMDQIK